MSVWVRALGAAALGAIVAALTVTIVTSARTSLDFDMNGPPPTIGRGFYSSERDGDVALAWTAGEATLSPAGLNRADRWTCVVRFRSGRPPDLPRATLLVTVDGAPAASAPAPDTFEDLEFAIPSSGGAGAVIGFSSTPSFTPGTADTRELGVQVDRIRCEPASTWSWPPAAVARDVAIAGAAFAFVSVAAGGSLAGALIAALAAAIGAAMMLTIGAAFFTGYSIVLSRAALGSAAGVGLLLVGLPLATRQRLSPWARFAILTAGLALFLKIIALMHPAKPIIDAMFHAHRLEWVAAGRWAFTQPFVGGVEMPYAIGLYVFALPWMWTTADHVALIRIVTATVDVSASLLLYPLVRRVWDDRRVAALAVLGTQVAPLPYVILGNANLANLFGQALALATVVIAVAMQVEFRRVVHWLVFVVVLAWALCSHVSTATTLACTLAVLAVLLFVSGDAALRRRASGIAGGVAAAATAAWVIYYRHFVDEFRAAFGRMFSQSQAAGGEVAATAEGYMTVPERVGNLFEQIVVSAGIPLLVLAAAGLVVLLRERRQDALTFALAAWFVVWLVFSASTVFARVDAEYVRYAAEFLGRINLATMPLVAILAARGAGAAWKVESGRLAARGVVLLLILWAIAGGAAAWLAWFDR